MQAAYYALHYGMDYLPWSIRSIQDAVSEIHIFYVANPSYGFGQGATCPETRRDLFDAAHRFVKTPIFWYDCPPFRSEGEHREYAVNTLRQRGAHQLLIVDADEVWLPGAARRVLDSAVQANNARNWSLPFVHFIRSTSHAVCDHFRPIRVIDLRHTAGDAFVADADPVLHFGYAQSTAVIRYKWTCHGHQAELRADWMERFMSWTPETRDLHPVVNGLWDKAEPLDAELATRVQEALDGHPFLSLAVIP